MGVSAIIFKVSLLAILIKLALATNYIVGGPNGGWDTNSNLQSWASSQIFSVGDSLGKSVLASIREGIMFMLIKLKNNALYPLQVDDIDIDECSFPVPAKP